MTHDALPATALAKVFHGTGAPLETRRFELPALAADEVLVHVECCTLCGSDLHTYLGNRSTPTPTVLGHEVLGRIAAFGAAHSRRDWRGAPLAVGDRVSWAVAASCGDCYFCQRDLPQKCTQLFKYGHEACDSGHPLSGGLADYCHLASGSALLRVPEEIPAAVASSANCAYATVAAARRAAGGLKGKSILVQGAGLLGLVTTAMASCDGAANVIVVDVDRSRLAMAERFGATTTVHIADPAHDLAACIEQLTAGRGVDAAFEMSGAAAAVAQALPLLRTGGRYILVGAVKPVGTIPLDIEQVVRRMWRIEGIHNYGPGDLAVAIDFLAANHSRFPFAELVAASFPLEQAGAAFDHMLAAKAIRVAVTP